MRHLVLTNKNKERIIIHEDTLKEAFPTNDGRATVCVLDVQTQDKRPETFMVVNETTEEIERQLREIRRKECDSGRRQADAVNKNEKM